MKSSLRSSLLALIEKNHTCTYGEIVTAALEYGAKISAAERRLRELAAENKIRPLEKKSQKGTNYIYAYVIVREKENIAEIHGVKVPIFKEIKVKENRGTLL